MGKRNKPGRGGAGGRARGGRGRGASLAAARGDGSSGGPLLVAPDALAVIRDRQTSRRHTVQLEESAFSKIDGETLERLNLLATYAPLSRPIPNEARTFAPERMRGPEEWVGEVRTVIGGGDEKEEGGDEEDPSSSSTATSSTPGKLDKTLRLPRRPRWRYDMTKAEVEANEREIYRQWLDSTDLLVRTAFRNALDKAREAQADVDEAEETGTEEDRMRALRARAATQGQCVITSQFERNLEVYRQLWRVVERSDILCVLLDSRCPLLHLPPALSEYLKRYNRMRTVLVLTKADLVPASLVERWRVYLHEAYGWDVVVTESYTKKERKEGQGSRARYTPYVSPTSKAAFFAALKHAHQAIVTPPPTVAADPERLAKWKPSCRADIDWDAVASSSDAAQSSMHAPAHARSDLPRDGGGDENHEALPFVTVGLIGQPNVGKSSLLNALVGSSVARASRTPGKTKHFATHFLGADRSVRLCDSPGLVFPSLVGMECQVLGAILPISQVQASTSCVMYAAQHLPLERILSLEKPPSEYVRSTGVPSAAAAAAAALNASGNGWGRKQERAKRKEDEWSATDILESLARRYNFKTAKAGRWDLNRAANGVMRQLAEGRILWAFEAPSEAKNEANETDRAGRDDGCGIWLPRFERVVGPADAGLESDGESDVGSESEDEAHRSEGDGAIEEEEEGEEEVEDEEEEEAPVLTAKKGGSMFAALMLDDGDDDDDEDEDEEV